MYGQPQVAQAVAVAQPVPQQMYGQPQQMYYGQPQQMYGQPQPMAPAIAVAQPVFASPQPAMGVAAPQGKKHESVHAFGFMPDYEWKNSARNLDGFYISCTGTPMFWFDDADINPCPALILCCAMPCYIPYPCPAVRCLKFSAVDEDTLNLSCGMCLGCPLSLVDPKNAGKNFVRDNGENGRALGPLNSFTREDLISGPERLDGRFEVSQYRLCGATNGICYLRVC
jgi:hypothetical protein